jgi:hypothetical protein
MAVTTVYVAVILLVRINNFGDSANFTFL